MYLKGQDPQFTQFYANPLYLSPSLAGATQKGNRVATSTRDQWAGFVKPGTFITQSISYDHYFSTYNSGVGVNYVFDRAGSGGLKYNSLGLFYSYDFEINDYVRCSPGISLHYFWQNIDRDKLVFRDQIRPDRMVATQDPMYYNLGRVSDLDFSASVLFYNEKIWAGFSVDHLRKPQKNFYSTERLPLKFSSFGGITLQKWQRLLRPVDETITIAYMFRSFGSSNQLDLGLYWKKEPLLFGFWYRGIPLLNAPRGDMIAVLAGVKIDEAFYVGYSYDITISNIITHSAGSHELAIIYEFKTKVKKQIRMVPCTVIDF